MSEMIDLSKKIGVVLALLIFFTLMLLVALVSIITGRPPLISNFYQVLILAIVTGMTAVWFRWTEPDNRRFWGVHALASAGFTLLVLTKLVISC